MPKTRSCLFQWNFVKDENLRDQSHDLSLAWWTRLACHVCETVNQKTAEGQNLQSSQVHMEVSGHLKVQGPPIAKGHQAAEYG